MNKALLSACTVATLAGCAGVSHDDAPNVVTKTPKSAEAYVNCVKSEWAQHFPVTDVPADQGKRIQVTNNNSVAWLLVARDVPGADTTVEYWKVGDFGLYPQKMSAAVDRCL